MTDITTGHFGHHSGHHSGVDLADLVLTNQVHDASTAGIRETADSARDTVHSVRDSIDASNQIGNINLQATERNGGDGRQTTERAAGSVRDAIAQNANQASRDHTTILGEICDVRERMASEFGRTNLEAVKQHCDLKLELTKQHAELARQVDARAAEASKQLAECCCKQEQLHAETRQLIQAQALDEALRREASAQNELNLLRIAAAAKPGNS